MEHLAHFGLAQDPFVNAPRVEDWCALPSHVDAERRLARGLSQGKGLLTLVGDSGSGKTTLVRHLLEQLDEGRFEASLIVIVPGEPARLLRRVARHLGVEDEEAERTETLRNVFDRLVELEERGHRAVVLIDGAESLAAGQDLDDLRALLGFEHGDAAMLSVLLVGGPALDALLQSDAGLRRRVEIRVRLAGLDRREVGEYVAHRVTRAGGRPGMFTQGAVAGLHGASLGLPRLVNTLADNALYEAFVAARRQVTPEDVGRAARDLGLEASVVDGAASEALEHASPVDPAARAALPRRGDTPFSVDDFPDEAAAGAAPAMLDAADALGDADDLGLDPLTGDDTSDAEPWEPMEDTAPSGEVRAAVDVLTPAPRKPAPPARAEADVLELSQPIEAEPLELVAEAEPAKPEEEVDELFAQLLDDPR
ncbi:MAG TPA: AAA family ATPase [Myxococcota bacterium]|nr:AAA family ATPase [Myxococcota bacterium]